MPLLRGGSERVQKSSALGAVVVALFGAGIAAAIGWAFNSVVFSSTLFIANSLLIFLVAYLFHSFMDRGLDRVFVVSVSTAFMLGYIATLLTGSTFVFSSALASIFAGVFIAELLVEVGHVN